MDWYWPVAQGLETPKVQYRKWSSQRTNTHDQGTRTMMWGLPEGVGGAGWRGANWKTWDNCNSIINKI